MKTISITVLFLLSLSCKQAIDNKTGYNQNPGIHIETKVYSQSVKDTFTVSVSLPENYKADKSKQYPVVYLLDANLYFDIVAATFKKFSEVGLLPPAILVGVGYKDLGMMDSLRQRDFTYPAAIAEYEMSISGGADRFLSFITNELIPGIDKKYPADKDRRVLMGHSLGGYFTLYSLHQNLLAKNYVFSSYIAASPSTHYNHNYILEELKKLKEGKGGEIKSYITFGGLEDTEEAGEDTDMLKTGEVLLSLNRSLKDNCGTDYRCDNYSNLGHMDTALPTFIKGLQWTLGANE